MAAYRNAGFSAENRFFKLQVDIFAQIGAALSSAALARAAAKNIAEAQRSRQKYRLDRWRQSLETRLLPLNPRDHSGRKRRACRRQREPHKLRCIL